MDVLLALEVSKLLHLQHHNKNLGLGNKKKDLFWFLCADWINSFSHGCLYCMLCCSFHAKPQAGAVIFTFQQHGHDRLFSLSMKTVTTKR